MKKGIQIKINGIWVNLEEDFEIDFKQTSFVFNDQGTFSFPFEIPLKANPLLVKNIADPFGKIYLSDLDYSDAEIWFDEILLYRGIVRTDDEVDIEDTLPFTFTANGGDFLSRIDKLNMRDVPLDRDIKLGYVVKTAFTSVNVPVGPSLPLCVTWQISLPKHIFMNYTESNVSAPYPASPYCNVRVCGNNGLGQYKILDAHRPYSGVCFYVMYFLHCLFQHLHIPVDDSSLYDADGRFRFEDLNRLAFFNTQCHSVEKGEPFNVILQQLRDEDFLGPEFELFQRAVHAFGYIERHAGDYSYTAVNVYATNENFPEGKVKELLDDLSSAFGLRFVYDGYAGRIHTVLLRDVFTSRDICALDVPIIDMSLTQTRARRIRLTYGVEDDTAFNYSDYSNLSEYPDYASIIAQGASVFDTRCFLDRKTGNTYRIKVNKETGRDPSFFEVGGFGDYVSGAIEGEDEETVKIGFAPVILNDVTKHMKTDAGEVYSQGQVLAAYTDVELKPEDIFNGEVQTVAVMSSFAPNVTVTFPEITARCPENYDLESGGDAPLQSYDAGYTLGVMRGPGNTARLEYPYPNYDGEGNSSFAFVESTYAFTADSCNNHGLFYDYNGMEPGGVEQEGRFSLKLTARKFDEKGQPLPIDTNYENRGLVSAFLSEYLYFMANKKTIVLSVDMTLSQIINIDFSKRYRIGDYVGFINEISYTLATDGVHNVEIELFAL